MRRATASVLVAVMLAIGALPGLAREAPIDRGAGEPVRVEVVDRPVDRVQDREVDRVSDRYRCVDFETDRRCIDDRHPHVDIRHLIQRLINAGEWEKLFRLLHRLGII